MRFPLFSQTGLKVLHHEEEALSQNTVLISGGASDLWIPPLEECKVREHSKFADGCNEFYIRHNFGHGHEIKVSCCDFVDTSEFVSLSPFHTFYSFHNVLPNFEVIIHLHSCNPNQLPSGQNWISQVAKL